MSDLTATDFLQFVARDVAGTLEEVVGVEEAKGYLSLVGESMASRLDDSYRDVHGPEPWSVPVVSEVLVDIQRRIDGGFGVQSRTRDEIVFENDRCPFGEAVLGRPSLCMMTSNVFGRVAANHLGHVTVELEETIARGDGRCVVRVSTDPDLAMNRGNRKHFFADV